IHLFNGKDLKGWVVMHGGKYSAQNGLLVLESGNGWLRTEKEYADFDITVEFRVEAKYKTSGKYDGGLFFRTPPEAKPWPVNKYQFNMKQGNDGDLPGIIKNGFPQYMNPPGEWNSYRLMCKGVNAESWINGKPAWKTDKIKTPKGYIGLQAEGHKFEFRK